MPKNEHDYGYFGKGGTGYSHYKQTFDETHNENRDNRQPSASGCGWLIVVSIAAILAVFTLFSGYGAEVAFEMFGFFIIGAVFLWLLFK